MVMRRKKNSSASFRKKLRASSDGYSHNRGRNTAEREREIETERGRQRVRETDKHGGLGKREEVSQERILSLTKTQLYTAYLSSSH